MKRRAAKADMNILGISCYYHDAAAALLQDGQLIAASEEERFSRIKHDFGFPSMAIQFCLDSAGIRPGISTTWSSTRSHSASSIAS